MPAPGHSIVRRNIELKARHPDLARARDAALALSAQCQGILIQSDTYFQVPSGRLKLRQTEGRASELIWYAREDSSQMRPSDYIITPIEDAATALAVLSEVLGIRRVVTKCRELLLLQNVRIHLDEVQGLGTFVEFEAVMEKGADEVESRRLLEDLRERLEIRQSDCIASSYEDL